MNSLFSILLKNTILLALIVVSLIFIFTRYIGFKEIQYIYFSVGACYVLASCFEAYKLSDIKSNSKKFTYMTDGFLTKRFIKVVIFLASGIVLYVSGSIIKYMAFLFFLIAFTEIVVTFWRYAKHLCFIAFEEDRVLISTSKLDTMRASEIAKIEARHGLTYFVNHQNKSFTVRTDMMKENQEFKVALNNWIIENDLSSKVVLL